MADRVSRFMNLWAAVIINDSYSKQPMFFFLEAEDEDDWRRADWENEEKSGEGD